MAKTEERALVVGWPSFVHGIASAGDVLGMEAARDELQRAGLPCDMALSAVFRPEALRLEDAEPARYTLLVFACGPLHGWQVASLHSRYAHCRRVAVGVSVIDPADPAAAGFHVILARDGDGAAPRGDLALHPRHAPVPVAGVILAGAQPEYGADGQGDQVGTDLAGWLRGWDCALVPLDTRLDREDWRLAYRPAELEAIIRRLDLMVTTRLHGLVLALKNGVPALAVDPVAGGAKVTAQARAWGWPAIMTTESLSQETLGGWRDWCLSPAGKSAAAAAAASPPPSPLRDLRRAAGIEHLGGGEALS
jgi:polysaccharide pyruvyl transferase